MKTEMSKTTKLALCALCIAVNIVLGSTVGALNLPFYGDTLGTIFTAIFFGPVLGAVVGFLSSFLKDLLSSGMQNLPFALVNIMIGLVVGFIFMKTKLTLIKSFLVGLLLSFLCALVGTPIGIAIYGGLTGTVSDVFVLFLKQSGASIFAASFIPKVLNNLIDKVGSCLIAYAIIKALPAKMKPTCYFAKEN
jgi:energy-coupling factor transport system substrate-specific component